MQPLLIGPWLGRQLKQSRRSMRQVAEYTGLSPSTISNIVAGKHVPEPSTCIKIAEYFKVDPDLVLELAGHRPPEPADDLPDFEMYISRRFRDNPALQRALIAAYEAIVSVQEERRQRVEALEREIEEMRRDAAARKRREDGGN